MFICPCFLCFVQHGTVYRRHRVSATTLITHHHSLPFIVQLHIEMKWKPTNTNEKDNTNADPETRAHWTSLAKDLKIPIRCVLFLASPELCKHNNAARAVNRTLVRLPYAPQFIIREKKTTNTYPIIEPRIPNLPPRHRIRGFRSTLQGALA